jgi:alcohol dehydrogenase class IV
MTQKEFIDVDGAANLAAIREELGASRIFLVTGKSSYDSSGARALVEKALEGQTVHRFSDFSDGPNFEDVMEGVAFFRKTSPDLMVAVGGGRALDMAKSINVFQAHLNDVDLLDLATGKENVRIPGIPLVALPTTAGTGSEATHFAVIYVDDKKYSLAHDSMLPDYSIVDPRLTHSQPAHVTACTGFDALCQAVESYWARSSTDASRHYASRAITIILENIRTVVDKPTPSVRAAMSVAANLAGKAINISKTTGPHALSYGLTRHYGVPHGHAVALMMGGFLKLHGCMGQKESRVQNPHRQGDLQEIMGQLLSWMGAGSLDDASQYWKQLMQDCGLEVNLRKFGVTTSGDIDVILEGVNCERLANHPVPVSQEMTRTVFESILGDALPGP